jgi:predicted RNase H-like nuclease (RuvC/YqgF family)
MDTMNNIYTVLMTAITVLGSAAAFRYYEKKSMRKERDEEFIRHDYKDRIAKLEALLIESSREKDELRKMVLELTKEVASLRTKIEFFEKGTTPVTTIKTKNSHK